jgi:hypothetical protein
MVVMGAAADDIDCAGVAFVPLRQPALAAVVYPRIGAHVSLVFCRRKLMAWLVWGPLLLMMTVRVLPGSSPAACSGCCSIPRNFKYVSLVFCRCKLIAWLVWRPQLGCCLWCCPGFWLATCSVCCGSTVGLDIENLYRCYINLQA